MGYKITEGDRAIAASQLRCCIETTQEIFLREMFPLFGLKRPPEASKIKCSHSLFLNADGMLLRSRDGGFQISLNLEERKYAMPAFLLLKEKGDSEHWREYLSSRMYVVAHEAAHKLRDIANPIALSVSHWDEPEFYEEPSLWDENLRDLSLPYPRQGDSKNLHLGMFLEEMVAEMSAIEFMKKIGRFSDVNFWACSNPFFAPAYRMLADHGNAAITYLVERDVVQARSVLNRYSHLAREDPLVPTNLRESYIHVEESEID